MCEGLDRDDIYVMVEDEFQTVAQTFTQHLHHAEYKRLKDLAKARNSNTISTISRPVDAKTTMRPETKVRKQAEAGEMKRKQALPTTPSAPRGESEIEDSDFDDETKAPWAGTHLQGLMVKSPRKNLASLTGLQGVKSSTRAAAGFSQSDMRPTSSAKFFNLDPGRPISKKRHPPPANHPDPYTTSDDDDLDNPMPMRNNRTVPRKRVCTESRDNTNPLPNTLPPSHELGTSSRYSSQFDDEPAIGTRSSCVESSAAIRRLAARQAKAEQQTVTKSMAVEEIPMFLG